MVHEYNKQAMEDAYEEIYNLKRKLDASESQKTYLRERCRQTRAHAEAMAAALEHGINVCKYPNVLEKGELAYAKEHMEKVLGDYRKSLE